MKWRRALEYTLINFATPIAFYITFRELGAKPAIGLAIGVTCLQLLAHWHWKIRMSPFFLIASGFTVAFGTIDLFLQAPRFFRLEPFVQNFLIATLLLVTLKLRIPLARHFVAALPKKLQPDPKHFGEEYLRKLTLIWVSYLYLKAAVFLYLAFHVDLGNLIVLRTLLGGGSLIALVLGEFLYRKYAATYCN